ncbi:MAG: MOSC domain-containing protein [Blastopirellula sp. JB062]
MNRIGQVVAVCVSQSGGIPRYAVEAIELTSRGVVGDKHRYLEHETNERAVSLFDVELYDQLQLDAAVPPPGSVGENVAVAGVGLADLQVGAEIDLGAARVQLTRRWTPCYARHPVTGKTRPNRQKLFGWFAMIAVAGKVAAGDVVSVVED